jgi:hypothetical protein
MPWASWRGTAEVAADQPESLENAKLQGVSIETSRQGSSGPLRWAGELILWVYASTGPARALASGDIRVLALALGELFW